MSSDHLIILCRNRATGELKIAPDITLYDIDGAEKVLETVKMAYSYLADADDWVISIYREHWKPVAGWETGDI